MLKEATAKALPKFETISMNVRTDDPKEKVDEFNAVKEKYTTHKITITEWWEHPYFNRGNSWWLTCIDGTFYDVHYSSHEFELKDRKIEYTLSLRVELADPSHIQNRLRDYKKNRHDFYQEQSYNKSVSTIKSIEKDYKARIEKLNEEMGKKIEEVRKSYYDDSWELAEEEIQRELYGKDIKIKRK
jgi:gas vesicle protein